MEKISNQDLKNLLARIAERFKFRTGDTMLFSIPNTVNPDPSKIVDSHFVVKVREHYTGESVNLFNAWFSTVDLRKLTEYLDLNLFNSNGESNFVIEVQGVKFAIEQTARDFEISLYKPNPQYSYKVKCRGCGKVHGFSFSGLESYRSVLMFASDKADKSMYIDCDCQTNKFHTIADLIAFSKQ